MDGHSSDNLNGEGEYELPEWYDSDTILISLSQTNSHLVECGIFQTILSQMSSSIQGGEFFQMPHSIKQASEFIQCCVPHFS